MNYTHLSIDQAPSIGTPVRFFITAPLFGITAIIVLLTQGTDILQDRWLPIILSVTHLFTLGFITMSMMGALFQLLPVLAGSNVYKASLTSKIVHILFTMGVIFLSIGLALSHQVFLQLALITLLPGLLLFLVTVSISLMKAQSNHASITGIRLAVIALWITVGLGSLLALGHTFESIALQRQMTSIHIAWAGIGWVAIMIVSIAYQVIPMFQVTNEYPETVKRFFSPTLFTILLAWSSLFLFDLNYDWLNQLVILLVCLLFIVFISITLHLLMQRKKRLADASLYFWLFGLVMLPISLLVFFFVEITGSPLHLLVGIIFIFGFFISIINGMLYKIVPFLVWLHLNQKLALSGRSMSDIPTMNEIIPMKQTYRQFYLHVASVLCLIFAVFYPSLFFYPAGILFLVNWVLLEWHLVSAMRVYYSYLSIN